MANKVEMAINVIPILDYLQKNGVLMIHNNSIIGMKPSVIITADLCKELFPEAKPDENGYYVTEVNGVKVKGYWREDER